MDMRESVRKHNDVALRLTKHVNGTQVESANLVFSPASIHVVLSLIAAGSGGSIKDRFLSFLRSQSTDQLNAFSSELVSDVFADGSAASGPRLSAANGVWIDRSLTFKPSFKHVVESFYKAASNQVDFQTKAVEALKEVNSWAEEQTNGLIKEVLPPDSVNSMTILIFANALYFKGAWDEKFDPSKTKDYDFHLLNGTSIRVPFMTSTKTQYISTFDGFKVLGLPYQRGHDKRHFSMYLFLPDAKDGLPALVEKIGSDSDFLDRHLPYRKVEVGDFRIPRFKISFGFEASKILEDLGLSLSFSGEGGLAKMVDCPAVKNIPYFWNIFHKSFVEVNEEGTEAAAATAAVLMFGSMAGSMVKDRIDFVADHPFLFLVREDITGVVLFIGQVLNPLEIN